MTASSMQEIEAKFGLTHARYTAALAGAPHLGRDFLLTPVTLVTQLDLYLDTADYALVRGGHALRLRHSAGKVQAGLKNLTLVGKNHWHQRLELEAFLPDPADPLDWSKWPAVLHDFLSTQLPEREPLHPFFLLQQNRQKRLVHTRARPGEAAVAELSIDEVQVYGLDSLPQGEDWSAVLKASEPLASFWTLEAELLEGQDEAQLAAIVEKLEHKRGLRPVHDSKFEQALRIIHHHLLVGDEHIEHWTPTLSIADGCRLVWREQLAQLLLNEAGVRYSDESEYVHDMRVAVRRMRTALRLFASYFRRKRLDRFGRALQALGQRLGALRDHDVALARLEKSREPSGQSDSHAGIESNWLRARNTLYRELLDWLDSEEYRRFLVEFSAFCAQAGKGARKFKVKPGERPLPYQVCHVLPALLMERYARIRAFEPLFASGEQLPAATLHRLRLQCKRLRYTLEFAQPLLGVAGQKLILALRALQDQLGALNDAAVSQRLLADVEDEHAQSVAAYYTAQQQLIDQLSMEVATAFADFTGPQTRRLVAKAATCV